MIVGLCHGVFDLLHFGHIRHFKAARGHCDRLYVSVTADNFVNKGPNRPFYTLEQRMEVLQSIREISEVIGSFAPTALQSLQSVKPHFFFKDAEYRSSSHPGFLEEQAYCSSNGVKIIFTEEQRSSSTAALSSLSRDSRHV